MPGEGKPLRRAGSGAQVSEESPQTAQVKLLDGSETRRACRLLDVAGAKFRLASKEALRAGAAVSMEWGECLFLAEVLACLKQGQGYELWLEVRHALPAAPASLKGRAEEAQPRERPAEVAALVEVARRSLAALTWSAIPAESACVQEFQESMRVVEGRLAGVASPGEVLGLVEAGVKLSAEHTRRTAEFFRRQLVDVRELLCCMLTIVGEFTELSASQTAPEVALRLAGLYEGLQRLSRRLAQHPLMA